MSSTRSSFAIHDPQLSHARHRLKGIGVDVSKNGVSVKTDKRFNHEAYLDATQRSVCDPPLPLPRSCTSRVVLEVVLTPCLRTAGWSRRSTRRRPATSPRANSGEEARSARSGACSRGAHRSWTTDPRRSWGSGLAPTSTRLLCLLSYCRGRPRWVYSSACCVGCMGQIGADCLIKMLCEVATCVTPGAAVVNTT